ncbi:alpha-tocopherol transfer protein-like [Chironomus tepperi]|uniref:alpha-tocopherol transfer protein-like n=1 Tax=Chironomus tepperi TaxID=113505 RepID=UPI00391F1D16
MANDLKRYQEKSITPVEEYVCTLSDDLQKIAENELRETDKLRIHSLKALRDWVMENQRIIKCRLDNMVLLKVLRVKKYSIPLAQETIERQLLFHEGLDGYDFFSNVDVLKPHVLEMLEKGLITVLPKRDENRRLTIYIRFELIDPAIPEIGNVFLSLVTILLEILTDDEENQIRGFNYIFDLSGANLKQLLIFPIDIWLKIGKNSEKALAIRHKSFHFLNVHPSAMFLIKFFMKHMPDKLRKRVKLYTTNLAESGIVPLDNIPTEYGGTIPMKTITDEWKELILSKKEYFESYKDVRINRALYPQSYLDCTLDSLKVPVNHLDFNNNIKSKNEYVSAGVIGSFRKLEID